MKTASRIARAVCIFAVLAVALGFDVHLDGKIPRASFVPSAFARIGRPLTPVSVAGVARRTTRRVVRRTTIYVASLPPTGCTQVNINGAMYFKCGATYYQASGKQYVVVNVD